MIDALQIRAFLALIMASTFTVLAQDKNAGDSQWRILFDGKSLEAWRGYKTEPDWEAKVKASKFSAYPNFGRARSGYLALQGDHAGTLAFRNIRIRKLF